MSQVASSRGGEGRHSDCSLEVGIAERRLRHAESALSRAATPEEFQAAFAAVASARRRHGFMLLKRDRLRRPHIYRK